MKKSTTLFPFPARALVGALALFAALAVLFTLSVVPLTSVINADGGGDNASEANEADADGDNASEANETDSDTPNRAPVFDSDTVVMSVPENSKPGTIIGTLSASDDDGDDLLYRLSYKTNSCDAEFFRFNRDTGMLRVKAPLDFEARRTYKLCAVVLDGHRGKDFADVTINVTDVKERPGSLTNFVYHRDRIYVTWDLPDMTGKPPLLGYIVERQLSPGAGWRGGRLGLQVLYIGYHVPGTQDWETVKLHVWRIRAYNDEGKGPWTFYTLENLVTGGPPGALQTKANDSRRQVAAPAQQPPGSVTEIALTAGKAPNRGTIDVSWVNPDMTGKQSIVGYSIEYRDATPSFAGGWQAHSYNGVDAATQITGLSEGHLYEVRVQARNQDGVGPWSSAAIATYSDTHLEPSGATSSGGSAQPPPAPTTQSQPTPAPVQQLPGSVTELTLTAGKTPNRSAMNVSWGSPDMSGKPPITIYELQYRDATPSVDSDWQHHSYDSWDTSIRITGLSEGYIYEVRVRAVNDDGSGPWASASVTTYSDTHLEPDGN